MTMDIVDQVRGLQNRNQELQAQWDHFQRLCRDHGAHGIGDLIVQRDELKQQRDELLAAAEQALVALGYAWDAARCTSAFTTINDADKALRAAIAKVKT